MAEMSRSNNTEIIWHDEEDNRATSEVAFEETCGQQFAPDRGILMGEDWEIDARWDDPDSWDQADWGWGAGDENDDSGFESLNESSTEFECDNTEDRPAASSKESSSVMLEGRCFSVSFPREAFPVGSNLTHDGSRDYSWFEITNNNGEAAQVLCQGCYQNAGLGESVLAGILESSPCIPEIYWAIYLNSAYGCGSDGLYVTQWVPVWDAEVQCNNGRCLLLQNKTGLGYDFRILPYPSSTADHIQVLFPRRGSVDEETAREMVMQLAREITITNPSENSLDDFFKEAGETKIDRSRFISAVETLTAVFISMQSLLISASLSRVARLSQSPFEAVQINNCFSGVSSLHAKASAYLERMLDAYDSQLKLGSTVSERSEVLSYIGAFDGNILPDEIPDAPAELDMVSVFEPSAELKSLRARLERARYHLRNNPSGNDADTSSAVPENNKAVLVKVGDEFTLGKYFWKSENEFLPIEWKVIAIKGTHALCVSKYSLDCQHFNEFEGDVTWETSTIRDWLNNEFADVAFDPKDRKKISGARVTNDPSPHYDTPGGNDTKDRIFLLSESEVRDLLSSEDRVSTPTPYAESKGANQWWWLRSPGHKESHTVYVGADGSINSAGTKACLLARAIRPAFYLKATCCDDLTIVAGARDEEG